MSFSSPSSNPRTFSDQEAAGILLGLSSIASTSSSSSSSALKQGDGPGVGGSSLVVEGHAVQDKAGGSGLDGSGGGGAGREAGSSGLSDISRTIKLGTGMTASASMTATSKNATSTGQENKQSSLKRETTSSTPAPKPTSSSSSSNQSKPNGTQDHLNSLTHSPLRNPNIPLNPAKTSPSLEADGFTPNPHPTSSSSNKKDEPPSQDKAGAIVRPVEGSLSTNTTTLAAMTTTTTTTAYTQPRVTDQVIDSLITSFAKGRQLGDKDQVHSIFKALVERYGSDNISPLGVTMIKQKDRDDTGVDTKMMGGDEDEKEKTVQAGSEVAGERGRVEQGERVWELVIHCAACVVTNAGAAMLFNVPHPLRSVEDFEGPCSEHLLSRKHQEMTKNMIASHLARYRDYRSGPGKRSRPRPDDNSSDEEEAPLRKRHVSGRTALEIAKVDPDPASPPAPTHGLSSERLREMISNAYDLCQVDLASDSIVSSLSELLLANNYDTQSQQLVSSSSKGNRDAYEGPPNMQLIAWDGAIKSVAEAVRVLGLEDAATPLEGMPFALTREQLTAAASIWYMADNPFEQTSGFMLCDSVGMGKTCAALTLFVRDRRGGQPIKPTMILAPAGIQYSVWMVEIRKHMPALVHHVAVVTTPAEWKAFLTQEKRPPIVIVSFELVQSAGSTDLVKLPNPPVKLSEFPAYRIIVDEFQHLRKSRTRLAKLAMRYAEEDHVKHVLLLSATPTPSDVTDLYVPLRMIKRLRSDVAYGEWAKAKRRSRYWQATGLMKELEHPFYMSRSFNYEKYLRDLGLSKAERRDSAKPYGNEETVFEILKSRLSELCKRDLEQTPSIPIFSAISSTSPVLEILEGMRILSLSFDAFYEWCREHESIVGPCKPLLGPISDSISRHETPVKIARVASEIIRIVEIDETAKILVVGHDNIFQAALQERLRASGFKRFTDFHTAGKGMICFDSTVDDREAKERMLVRFATQNSIPVLMGPMVPLSEGKNLQMCNYLFILDCPRSPAAMIQLTGRLVRQGQKRSVAITRFITEMGPDAMHEKLVFVDGTPLGDLRLPTITYRDLGRHMIRLSR